MTITRAIAAAAMLAGLPVGAASTAWADPPTMNGHYIRTVTNAKGQAVTNDWYFTPCGDGCAQLTTPPTAQAQLVNGQWTMDLVSDAVCPDGSTVPAARGAHYMWDPNTLAGTVQITVNVPACGEAVGQIGTAKLQLRQAP
jgi:hypothetical protein